MAYSTSYSYTRISTDLTLIKVGKVSRYSVAYIIYPKLYYTFGLDRHCINRLHSLLYAYKLLQIEEDTI
jgi:hypothetical protein